MLSDEDIQNINNDARCFRTLLEHINEENQELKEEVSRLNFLFQDLIDTLKEFLDTETPNQSLLPSISPEYISM